MEYQNLASVNLMIWEVNPRKRDNSTISFYENKDVKLVEGDSILGLRDEKNWKHFGLYYKSNKRTTTRCFKKQKLCGL